MPHAGGLSPRSPWPRWTGRWPLPGSRPGTGPGCSCSPRGRTATSARSRRPARSPPAALAAASEAGDNWAMGWALHVLALVTAVQGHMTDALPLFDRALTVTQADPALTDLRLLLQINKAVTLGNLDRYEEALTAAGQARQLAEPGRHDDPAGAGARRPGPAALRDGAMGRCAGRGGDPAREPEGTRRGLLRSRHRRRDQLPPRRDRRGAAPPRRGRPARQADRAPAYRPAGRSPAAWTASRTARCRRRWPR